MAESAGILLDNFESDSLANHILITQDGSNTFVIDESAALHGVQGLRLTFDGTNDMAHGTRTFPSNRTDTFARCYFRFRTGFSADTNAIRLFALRYGTSVPDRAYVQFRVSTGVLSAYRAYYYTDSGMVYVACTGGTITLNDIKRLEMHYQTASAAGANNGVFSATLDGVNLFTPITNIDNDTALVDRICEGQSGTGIPTVGSIIDIDDIKVDSAAIGAYADATTYTITYDGNTNTGGAVPVDATGHAENDVVSVLENSGLLTKTGSLFTKWNTAANGTGTDYYANKTITMPAANTTLYAVYEAVTTYAAIGASRAEALAKITGTTYHIATTGDDNAGTGSAINPWATIAKARTVAVAGDGIMLATGTYASFTWASTPASDIVIMNESGALPVLLGSVTITGSHLYMFGIEVNPTYVNPGAVDPQYAESTQTSYNQSLDIFTLTGCTYVSIVGCKAVGYNKYLCPQGFSLVGTDHVEISWCEAVKCGQALAYSGDTNLLLSHNHMHEITRTAFSNAYGSGICVNVVIEYNYGHDANYDYADDYCPRAVGENYHGSACSIRSPGITIRNNIFHDGFDSAGIMTYSGDYAGEYYDIIIEGNLLYDIRNVYCLRLYQAGHNIVVRNNTLISYVDSTVYSTAMSLHTIWTGYDGSNITIANNIIVGLLALGAYASTVDQHNNICYAVTSNGVRINEATFGGGTKIICQSSTENLVYFNAGFFKGQMLDWTLDETDPTNVVGHHKVQDYSLAGASEALDFGLTAETVPTAIGAIIGDNIAEAQSVTDGAGAWHGVYSDAPATTYSVTYSANSATSGTVPASQTKTHDVSLTLQTNSGTLARTGYTFAGWNTAANGSGTTYAVGATYTTNAPLTLYARWTMDPFTVTYVANGSTGGAVPVDVTVYDVGDTLTALGNSGNLVRTDYIWTGWRTSPVSGRIYILGDAVTVTQGMSMYACWIPKSGVSGGGNAYAVGGSVWGD